MKAFLRTSHFLEESLVPPAADPRDEEEKERYVTRQLRWALIGLGLFALAMFFDWGGAHAASEASVGKRPLFAPTVDLADALERARREGRSGVAVLYEMDGCGECARLKSTTFKDETLRRELRAHFVPVSLRADEPVALRDFDGRATTQASFANDQRVYALPTLVFYDLDGTPVARQPGSRWPVGEWVRFARYVRSAGYEQAPFTPLASVAGH
jgi:thioredoxin-related protein